MTAGGYAEDLAAIHAAGFTFLAEGAARELAGRLAERAAPATILELGCGDGTTAAALCGAGHAVHGIDLSAAMVALARERAPEATFDVGSFADAPLGGPHDAVLAAGEVLAYRLEEPRTDDAGLDAVVARVAAVLRPGGLFLFDLPRPGRVAGGVQRSWAEGEGWAVLVDAAEDEIGVRRRIVTFRERRGAWRRGEETHLLSVHRPAAVLALLREHGFTARSLPGGYAGATLPGVTFYAARRRR